MQFDLVITRHKGLLDYLTEEGIIHNFTEAVEHATAEMVKGKNVIGVLPHSLSCLCESYSEIPLAITPDMRGKELSCEDVRKIAGELVTYSVKKV